MVASTTCDQAPGSKDNFISTRVVIGTAKIKCLISEQEPLGLNINLKYLMAFVYQTVHRKADMKFSYFPTIQPTVITTG